MIDFKREIQFDPAYDKRHSDPAKDYGIHGLTIRWFLRGPKGMIQFVLYSNWHLPHVEVEQRRKVGYHIHGLCKPLPADIGYHSPKPMYDGHAQTSGDCEFVEGGKCYYDGSSLNAEAYFDTLVRDGCEALWTKMEEYYRDRFEVSA
jgi:hypothetical protein